MNRNLRWVFSTLPALAVAASTTLHAAAPRRVTIVDYYLQLPEKTFERSAKEWLAFLRQPNCGVCDLANGYLSCIGDGAQPAFEVALFRYQDSRPLLAVCQGELEGPNSKYLAFYEPDLGGRMQQVKRSIFPVADGKGCVFELPRKGRTIIVRAEKGGKVRATYTWNGEKFAQP